MKKKENLETYGRKIVKEYKPYIYAVIICCVIGLVFLFFNGLSTTKENIGAEPQQPVSAPNQEVLVEQGTMESIMPEIVTGVMSVFPMFLALGSIIMIAALVRSILFR